ncbi:RDD family protein [Actinomadura kijaniata]|uniref:RDD family protein n=1 Tax=Actinomadura kijaniata TaxID=46161 RepID=UPI003F1E4491
MTQPPQGPGPGEQPENQSWQPPGGAGPSFDKQQQPPPYQGAYGGQEPYGGQPPYGGQSPYGAQDPGWGMPSPGGPGHGQPYPGPALASRWRRLGAAIVDSLLLGVLYNLLLLPFPDPVRIETAGNQFRYIWNGTGMLVNLLTVVVGFLYYWLMHARFGQTLGKMLLKTRVVRETDGGAISSGTAAWRYGVQILLSVPCGIGSLLDALWILWDPRKQTLHDKIAHTVVVDAVPGQPDPYRNR